MSGLQAQFKQEYKNTCQEISPESFQVSQCHPLKLWKL